MNTCPCGSNQSLSVCCQPLLDGNLASSPEALMRSRYTAYALKKMAYIKDTTDPQAASEVDMVATEKWAQQAKFFKLEILRSTDEGNKGIVEFKAHFSDTDG